MRIVDDMLAVMALSSQILELNNAELYRVYPYASVIILFLFYDETYVVHNTGGFFIPNKIQP